jgi:hypothetical protein
MRRIFLLSPAHCGGERARLIFRQGADFELVSQLRGREGVPLGEVFSFVSGLYFRGKLAYARAFALPPPGVPGVLVITSNLGLQPAERPVNLATLRRFQTVDIHEDDPPYRRPLLRDLRRLHTAAGHRCEPVFLGSVATGKYLDLLTEVFQERLLFPPDFVGRGDLSRGGLLLRSARAGRELEYSQVLGAARHGPRPPRLEG